MLSLSKIASSDSEKKDTFLLCEWGRISGPEWPEKNTDNSGQLHVPVKHLNIKIKVNNLTLEGRSDLDLGPTYYMKSERQDTIW